MSMQRSVAGIQEQALIARSRPGRLSTMVRLFRRNRGAVFGLGLLTVLCLIALSAPLIAPYDPAERAGTRFLEPGAPGFVLGTDSLGRDVLSRLMHGARISLIMGLISVSIAGVIGVPLGLVSGYYGGKIDGSIQRVIDIQLAFPGILLALVIIAVLGPSLVNVMMAIGISSIPSYTRLARASTLAAKGLDYITAARALGCTDSRIIFLHLLPNVFAPIIVVATLGLAFAILNISSLSFIGLGAQPPTPEWGAMAAEGRNFMRNAWWLSTLPGVAIMLAVLSINLMGDGLRDALDPRMKSD